MRLLIGVVMVLALSAVAVPATAQATDPSLRLEYAADLRTCPSESDFRDLVAARFGADPFGATGSHTLRVEAEASGPSTIEVRVTLDRDNGSAPASKVFRGGARQCTELLRRAALSVALLLDDAPTSPSRKPPPPQIPADDAPRPIERTPPRPPSPSPSPHAHWAFGVSAALHAGGGALRPGPGFDIAASYEVGSLSLGVFGRLVLPTEGDFSTGRISTTTIGGGPVACLGNVRFALCVPVSIGAITGTGSAVVDGRDDASPFLTLGVRPQIRFLHVGPIALTAFAEGYYSPTITTFRFRTGPAWSTSAVGGLVGFSTNVHFP